MSANNFYPPPPVFIGGRQPYQPKLGVPQSGPAPQAPPIRAAAVLLSILAQSWQPAAYALPPRVQIAPLVAAPSAPPARSNSALSLIIRSWDAQTNSVAGPVEIAASLAAAAPSAPPAKQAKVYQSIIASSWDVDVQTVIALSSAALASIDEPPRSSKALFYSLIDAWRPAPYSLPPQARVATQNQAGPGAPPPSTDVALSVLIRSWDPVHSALPVRTQIAALAAGSTVDSTAPVPSGFASSLIARHWDQVSYRIPPRTQIAPRIPAAAVPDAPPASSGVTLSVIYRSWEPGPYSLPDRARVASNAQPSPVADVPPVSTDATLSLIVSSWDSGQYHRPPARASFAALMADQQSVPYSRASLSIAIRAWEPLELLLPRQLSAAVMQRVDQPVVPGKPLLASIVRQWTPEPYELPSAGSLAPFIEAPTPPDFAPVRGYAALYRILEAWQPELMRPPSKLIVQGRVILPSIHTAYIRPLSNTAHIRSRWP